MKTICCPHLGCFLDSELGVMSIGEAVFNSAAGNYSSYLQWWWGVFFVLFFASFFFFFTFLECNGLDKSPGRKVVLQSNWLIEYKRFLATKIIYSGYLQPCSLHAHIEESFFFKKYKLNHKRKWWQWVIITLISTTHIIYTAAHQSWSVHWRQVFVCMLSF